MSGGGQGSFRHHEQDTFLANFLCFRCFAALAFSILCLKRTGVRLDLGSADRVSTGQKYAKQETRGKLRTPEFLGHCRDGLWLDMNSDAPALIFFLFLDFRLWGSLG